MSLAFEHTQKSFELKIFCPISFSLPFVQRMQMITVVPKFGLYEVLFCLFVLSLAAELFALQHSWGNLPPVSVPGVSGVSTAAL